MLICYTCNVGSLSVVVAIHLSINTMVTFIKQLTFNIHYGNRGTWKINDNIASYILIVGILHIHIITVPRVINYLVCVFYETNQCIYKFYNRVK